MPGEVSGALWRWFAVLAVSAQVAAVVGGWRGSGGFFGCWGGAGMGCPRGPWCHRGRGGEAGGGGGGGGADRARGAAGGRPRGGGGGPPAGGGASGRGG